MKTQLFKYWSVLIVLALSLGLGQKNQAFGQSCVISFDGPAGDVLTSFMEVYQNYPNCDATFDTLVQLPNQPLPVGTYLTWCVDTTVELDPSQNYTVQGTTYIGTLYPDCDTNLDNELPPGHTPTSYVSPAVWQEVNYLLNHKNGAYFWDVQQAVNTLVGGPETPASPDYPPFDQPTVDALVNAASNNAAAWVPQCGDVMGAVYVITTQVGLDVLAPVQLVILEVPYCPITFTKTPASVDLGCNPTPSSIPDAQIPVNTNLVFATSCCGYPLTYTCTKSEATLGCLEYRYLTFTASDGYANTATYTQTITWTNDTTAPVILTAPASADLGCNPGSANMPTDASVSAQVTASDGCSAATINVSHADSGSPCAMTRTFTITAIDGCSNSSTPLTVVYTWTVNTNAPVITSVPPGGNLGCNPATLPTDASVTAQVVVTDNCTMQSTNVAHVDSGSPCAMTRTFTVTATDGCGNSSLPQTVVYTWTVDTNAPVITSVPAGGYLGCNPTNLPTSTNVAAQVTATDNCTLQSTNISSVDGGTPCAMTRTFTVTVTDGCGNSSLPQTVVYTWTVDTNAPVITSVPAGGYLGCNPTNLPTSTNVAAQVTATDNCTLQSTNVTSVDGGTPCAMTRTFTVTVTDGCGNSSTPQTVVYTWTVNTNAPAITSLPPGGSLGCNPAVLPTDASVAAQVAATDNCTLQSTNVTHVDGGSPCAMTRTFTISATDACGNSSTPQTVVYTWTIDTTAPVISSVPTGGSLGCNPTNLPTDVSLAAQVVATDNCTLQSTNVAHVDGGSDCASNRTFTITVTDGCGNISAPQTVVYTWTIDTNAPVILSVPAGGFLGCNPTNLPTTTNVAAQVTATDNCTLQSTNVTSVDSGSPCAMTRTFTITVTDGCGNLSTPQTVVYTWVVDTNAPVITSVPPGGFLGMNPAVLPASTNVAAQITATDNCTLQSTNISCVTVGTTNVTRTFTITVMDGCGNISAPATVVYYWEIYTNTPVIVITTNPPVITQVPPGGNLGCNPALAPTDASVAALVVATNGSCALQSTNVSHVDSGSDCAMTRTFTITITDTCGNISAPQTVVYNWVIDTTAPVVTNVPPGGYLGCNPAILPTSTNATAQIEVTDNCTVESTNVTCVTTTNGSTITRTFTITAADECGNISAPSTVVYTWISDTTAPVITSVPTGGNLGCNPTNLPTAASVSAQVVATANCNLQSTNVSCLTTTNGSTITRTFTITTTDQCGNISAPSTVVYTWISDTTAPVITHVPAGGNLGCNPTNLPTAASVTAQVVATANCNLQSTNVTCLTSTNGSTITRTFTITATDQCGNISAPSTVVYTWIVDTTTPVITSVPTGGSLGCNPTNLPTTASVAAQVVATNVCPIQSTNVTCLTTTNGSTITRTFTITATDECNNISAPSTVVYTWISDTTAPVITHVPTGGSLGCNPTNLPTTATVAAQVVATANCNLQSTNVTCLTTTNGSTITRTFTITATDQCGNISSPATVVYTWIVDTTTPVITSVPTGGSLGCNPTNLPTTASVTAQVVATNVCPIQSTNVSYVSSTNGSTVTRTFTITATDECGKISAPSTVVYTWISDTTAPVITHVPTGGSLGCNPTNLPTTASVTAQVVATANCNLQSTNVTCLTTTNGSSITRTFTITATDQCGNISAPATVVYTWIVDPTNPVITHLPTGGSLGCNPTNLPTTASVTAQVVATNVCSIQSTNASYVTATNGSTITRTFTITATDQCGNVSAPATVVYTWISDTTAPVITHVPTGSSLGCNPTNLPTTASVAAQVVATANCNLQSTNVSYVTSTNGSTITRTFTITATDQCGNLSAPATVVYTWISDTTAPVITHLPTGSSLGCNPTNLPTVASVAAQVVATANCNLQSTNVSLVNSTNECTVTGTFTITVTDQCGNVSTPATVVYTWIADTTPPVVTCPPNITLSNSVVHYCTFTPGDYGAPCNGTNAASLLTNCFQKVYPGGWVQCGLTNSGGYCLKFTSGSCVQKFVTCGGNPGCLTASYSNPTSCNAGVFAGEALCLQLNVNFGDSNNLTGFSAGCGNLVLNDCTSPLNGCSVRQILGICNTALGGGNISSYGCTISNLSITCSNLNQSFENCNPSAWCASHLVPPAITNVPPSVSGTATVSDKCSSTPTLTYSDVITPGTCPQTYVIARTWTAVDGCGNSNSCTQTINIGNSEASVCGSVFNDYAGYGFLTPGLAPGISNVTVTLKNSGNTTVATTTTDGSGSYCFYNLTPGTYTVSITQPTNYVQTGGTCTNHWLNNSNQQCWVDNDGCQHCEGTNGVNCWTDNNGYQHSLNANNQDCWNDNYGNYHQQSWNYVSCDAPANNSETITVAACEALTCVNFSYQGTWANPVVCVTGPSKGTCGQTGTYTCCVTNAGTACFSGGQVSCCGNTYTCPALNPGQGCSFQVNYQFQNYNAGNFNCQATATCNTYLNNSNNWNNWNYWNNNNNNWNNNNNSGSSCTAQGSCSTSVSY